VGLVVVMLALAGCSALPTGQSEGETPNVSAEDDQPGATNVSQTLRITVNETTRGSEFSAIGASYPRENFTVDPLQHEDLVIGVDTDGDGELDREFNETHVSGVNNNAYSFDITLETDHELQQGDVIVVRYPDIDNPTQPGTYDVDVRLNDRQTTTAAITIE
jgi:hypothetical protein